MTKEIVIDTMKSVKLGDVAAIRKVHATIDKMMDDGDITKAEHRQMCSQFTEILRSKRG